MTGTGVLWPSFYTGDGSRIRKWLYGSVLVRDWDSAGSTDMSSLPVFASNGQLNPDLLKSVANGGHGFQDVGSITENGVEFIPQFTADETMIWQSRRSQRTDITKDDEEVQFSMAETTPLTDYLWFNLPIGSDVGSGIVPALGTSNYSLAKPNYSDVVYRQLLIIGVDGSIGPNGQPEYVVELRPRVSLAKKSKKQWGSKQVDVTELTFTTHIDPFSGFDSKVLRGGSVWLAEGGAVVLPSVTTITATASSTGKGTIVFNAPTSPNQPFTYTVTQQANGSGGYSASTVFTPAATVAGVVTIVLSGLTASSTYTFKVGVAAANGTTAVYPAASNSITAT